MTSLLVFSITYTKTALGFLGELFTSPYFFLFVLILLAVSGWFLLVRIRDISLHLGDLAVNVQDNSRAIVIIRRSLDDTLDTIAALKANASLPNTPGENPSSAVTSALGQEIESLRMEFLNNSKTMAETAN